MAHGRGVHIFASGGVLLARMSSEDDIAGRAVSGREVETRYYDHGGLAHRYLTEADEHRFFAVFGITDFFEEVVARPEPYYSRPKMMWAIQAERKG